MASLDYTDISTTGGTEDIPTTGGEDSIEITDDGDELEPEDSEEFEYIDEVDESVVVEESTIDVPILNRTVSAVDLFGMRAETKNAALDYFQNRIFSA